MYYFFVISNPASDDRLDPVKIGILPTLENTGNPEATENDGIIVDEASDSELSCAGSLSSDIFNRYWVV